MLIKPEKIYRETELSESERRAEERQMMALDTLSKLAKQFSNRPDFGQLNELLVLTLSGQFSAPNACALIRQPGTRSQVALLYATGSFRNDKLLLSQELTDEHCTHFLKNSAPTDVLELTQDACTANLGFMMAECGVKLVVPLLHNDGLIGIIGLGEKVTRKPFEQSDLELLDTLVNTITPFLSSSFLFWEKAGLNKWYLDILNGVKQGVFVFDSHHRLKKVNTTGFNILKTFKPHLVHLSSLDRVPIELIFQDNIFGIWAGRFKEAADSPQGKLIENMVATSGDIKRIYNVHISQVTSGSVLETDLIITLDDITDQKESEHRLFELQKLADMGAMASSISHELNNFLGLVLGGVELAQMAQKRGDAAGVDSNLEKTKKSISKMERFTSGLMDYTKLDTMKKLENLNSVIRDVLVYVTAQEKFGRIRVIPELDPRVPDFEIDADQVAQLILNLTNNAADAINEAQREVGKIVIKTMADNSSASLSVSDNGVGMTPEVKEKLFKTHMTTKEHGHGHGLVTCGKIIDNHGAEVSVETELGTGTTFTLRFPLSQSS